MAAWATEIRALYAELETRRNGRSWSVSDLMAGFVGDVGAFVRTTDGLEEHVHHEFGDSEFLPVTVRVLLRPEAGFAGREAKGA